MIRYVWFWLSASIENQRRGIGRSLKIYWNAKCFPPPMPRSGSNFVPLTRQKLLCITSHQGSVWPDWAIYWTLGNFSKPVATISLPKSPTFLGNFCKGVKIFHFSSEIIFGQLLQSFGDFLLVTLWQGWWPNPWPFKSEMQESVFSH